MPLLNYSYLEQITSNVTFKKKFLKLGLSSQNRVKLATAFFFFGMGFCFASWASRIPDIKTFLHLSEADLGSLLFAIPAGQILAMPLSGKVVTKYGSKKVSIIGLLLYSFLLIFAGFSNTVYQLAFSLFLFGFFGNFCNIAVNTQGVITQQLLSKPIIGSFHGSWSLAGFTGALFGLIMISLHLKPFIHFILVFLIVALIVIFNASWLVKPKRKNKKEIPTETKPKISFFKISDPNLIWFGVICFCGMASEGIMFDWSGVYFKDIIKAPQNLVILGYTSFMISMASGRFLSDIFVEKIGPKKLLITSGIAISTGLYWAVIFPSVISCTLAFMLVGFGVANVVPTIFNAAGKSEKVEPGMALTIVSGISFLGFLMGPPVIGYIAEATSLKYSFAVIGIFGILIALIVSRLKIKF